MTNAAAPLPPLSTVTPLPPALRSVSISDVLSQNLAYQKMLKVLLRFFSFSCLYISLSQRY
jgi:hypothetical protein